MILDPLHFVLAAGPLALYLLLLGGINLSARPLVTTGGRDTLALAIGIAGCAIVGPMELLFPESFAGQPWLTWIMLLSLYGTLTLMIVLLSRPRLVIYNFTVTQLRPTLERVVRELDADAHWAGDCAYLPNLGIQFVVERFVTLKNVQLVATSPAANFEGWRLLEVELVKALRAEQVTPNPFGFVLTTFSTLLTAIVLFCLISNPGRISRSLEAMLFLEPPPPSAPAESPTEEPVDAPPIDKPNTEPDKATEQPAEESQPQLPEPPADNS